MKITNQLRELFSPKKIDIVLFHSTGKDLIMPYFRNYRVGIFDFSLSNLNIIILVQSIFLSRGNIKNIKDIYLAKFLQYSNPKIVFTFIDNDARFYRIEQINPSIITFFIQNGYRGGNRDVFDEKFDNFHNKDCQYGKVSYMFTFGKEIGEKYTHFLSGKYLPIGSFRSNLIPVEDKSIKSGTLLFISNFEFNNFFAKSAVIYILNFLSEYILKKGVKLVILARTDSVKEYQFYFKNFKGVFEFIPRQSFQNTYQILDNHEVVLNICSTLGYEAASRGIKTAFFHILNDYLDLSYSFNFAWPKNVNVSGLFWTNKADFFLFEEILDRLFMISKKEYNKFLEDIKFQEIIEFDPENRKVDIYISEILKNTFL